MKKAKTTILLTTALASFAALASCNAGDNQPVSDSYIVVFDNEYGKSASSTNKEDYIQKARFTVNGVDSPVFKVKKGEDCDVTIKFSGDYANYIDVLPVTNTLFPALDRIISLKEYNSDVSGTSNEFDPRLYTFTKDEKDSTSYKLHISKDVFKTSVKATIHAGYKQVADNYIKKIFVPAEGEGKFYYDVKPSEIVNKYLTKPIEITYTPTTYLYGSTFNEDAISKIVVTGTTTTNETVDLTKEVTMTTNNLYSSVIGGQFKYPTLTKGLTISIDPVKLYNDKNLTPKYQKIELSLKEAGNEEVYLPLSYSYKEKFNFGDNAIRVNDDPEVEYSYNGVNLIYTIKPVEGKTFSATPLSGITIEPKVNGNPYFRRIEAVKEPDATKGQISIEKAWAGDDELDPVLEGFKVFSNGSDHHVIALSNFVQIQVNETTAGYLDVKINLNKFIKFTQLSNFASILTDNDYQKYNESYNGSIDFLDHVKFDFAVI